MTISVYTKEGCKLCSSAKEKLDRMGLEYESRELQPFLDAHDGWREDGSIEVLAGYASVGSRLPVIRIGGDFHDYAGAMRRLKTSGLAGEAGAGHGKAAGATPPEPVVH